MKQPPSVTVNNAVALLEELQTNKLKSGLSLMAWADAEDDIINQTIDDLKAIQESE